MEKFVHLSYHTTCFLTSPLPHVFVYSKVYFIERGAVEVLAVAASLQQDTSIHPTTTTTTISSNGSSRGSGHTGASAEVRPHHRLPRVNKISAGGIFGEAAFFLDLPQSVRCVALQSPAAAASLLSSSMPSMATALSSSSSSRNGSSGSGSGSSTIVLWTLDRASYLTMETRHPQLCLLIQHALLKVRQTDRHQRDIKIIISCFLATVIPLIFSLDVSILHYDLAFPACLPVRCSRVWPSPTRQHSLPCIPRPPTAYSSSAHQISHNNHPHLSQ